MFMCTPPDINRIYKMGETATVWIGGMRYELTYTSITSGGTMHIAVEDSHAEIVPFSRLTVAQRTNDHITFSQSSIFGYVDGTREILIPSNNLFSYIYISIPIHNGFVTLAIFEV
jgi:hypothetical protein